MVNFGRKPQPQPTPKDPDREALDLLLKGKSDEYKGKVLTLVRQHKIDANDPVFLLVAGISNLDVALIDIPHQIEKILAQYLESIAEKHTQTQSLVERQLNSLAKQTDSLIDTIATTAESLERHQDRIAQRLERDRESFHQMFERNHCRNKELVQNSSELVKRFESERLLRMEKPYLTAVNLPAYILLTIALMLVGSGILVGANINNQAAKLDAMQQQLDKIDPNQIHLGIAPPTPSPKKHQQHHKK